MKKILQTSGGYPYRFHIPLASIELLSISPTALIQASISSHHHWRISSFFPPPRAIMIWGVNVTKLIPVWLAFAITFVNHRQKKFSRYLGVCCLPGVGIRARGWGANRNRGRNRFWSVITPYLSQGVRSRRWYRCWWWIIPGYFWVVKVRRSRCHLCWRGCDWRRVPRFYWTRHRWPRGEFNASESFVSSWTWCRSCSSTK